MENITNQLEINKGDTYEKHTIIGNNNYIRNHSDYPIGHNSV